MAAHISGGRMLVVLLLLLMVLSCAGGSSLSQQRLEIRKHLKRLNKPGGGNDVKAVLDAFFLGKAVAEAVTERIEATVGEFSSVIGQWQAEQRKQIQDLQEEVFVRATKAKEKAAREALEEKGIILKSTMASSDAGTPAVEPQTLSPIDGNPLPDTNED